MYDLKFKQWIAMDCIAIIHRFLALIDEMIIYFTYKLILNECQVKKNQFPVTEKKNR